MADNEDEFPEIELDHDDEPTPLPAPTHKKTADELLPQALIEHEIGMDGIARINDAETLALVVQAPSSDWVSPLYRHLRTRSSRWDFHHKKTEAPRPRSEQDNVAIEQATRALTMGGRCLGVSHQLAWLPRSMLAAADMTLKLPFPNAKVVNAVIRAVTGKMPRGLEDRTISVLDFDEIALNRTGISGGCLV